MPAYGSQVITIAPGDVATLWSAEQPAQGTASQAVAIQRRGFQGPASVVVDLAFASAPGSFEVDIQQADSNVATDFTSIPGPAAITAVDSTTFRATTSLSPFQGAFLRLLMKTVGNAVNVTATVSQR